MAIIICIWSKPPAKFMGKPFIPNPNAPAGFGCASSPSAFSSFSSPSFVSSGFSAASPSPSAGAPSAVVSSAAFSAWFSVACHLVSYPRSWSEMSDRFGLHLGRLPGPPSQHPLPWELLLPLGPRLLHVFLRHLGHPPPAQALLAPAVAGSLVRGPVPQAPNRWAKVAVVPW